MNPLFLSLGAMVGSQTLLRAAVARQPFPMPRQFATMLDHPLRLRYRNVSETLALFGFRAGMTVLDLGCGTGTFTTEIARMVGAEGKVHAVDLQRPLLEVNRQRIEAAGVAERIQLHHVGIAHLPLADESVDLAVMIATLGEIEDKFGALTEVRRVLKNGGRLAISEELLDPGYLPAPSVSRWLDEARFRLIGKSGTPFCYSMIFEK
ncbi:MAG: methyltransferase domain-containing protein [Caldilineaceae bacterium]